MSDNLKVAKECGALIKYILSDAGRPEPVITMSGICFEAYTSRILAEQQAAHDAEIARLKEEKRAWTNKWEALKLKHDLILPVAKGLEEQLSEANAACAMHADAWNALKSAGEGFFAWKNAIDRMDAAISASPQQVSEWEAKKQAQWNEESNSLIGQQDIEIETLRAQVAAWVTMVESLVEEFGDESWQEVIQQAKQMLADSKAAAEQFIAECEQRGAVKALEAHHDIDSNGYCSTCRKTTDGKCNAAICATSKKAG